MDIVAAAGTISLRFLGWNSNITTEPRNAIKTSPHDAWRSFEDVVSFLEKTLNTASQFLLITETCRNSDPLFALACFAKPMFCVLGGKSLWLKGNSIFPDAGVLTIPPSIHCAY